MHRSDQCSDVDRDWRPTKPFLRRTPAPLPGEEATVPRDDGGGFHDLHGPPPAAPHSREQHPQESVGPIEPEPPWCSLLEDASWWRSAKISAWSSTRVRRLDRMAATRAMTLGCVPRTVSGETGNQAFKRNVADITRMLLTTTHLQPGVLRGHRPALHLLTNDTARSAFDAGTPARNHAEPTRVTFWRGTG